jgi:hypothetical protein
MTLKAESASASDELQEEVTGSVRTVTGSGRLAAK